MKTRRHSAPQINAGSMADIAFLLLIFFLVTAMIPKDKGFLRKLPENCPPGQNCNSDIKQKNVLEINIISKNELLVENELIDLSELKAVIIDFLDNNGTNECTYCEGARLKSSSDHPKKAVISLKNDNNTSYQFYIAVQDQLTLAYLELRSKYAEYGFGKDPEQLTAAQLKETKEAYPFLLSEVENSSQPNK